MSVETLDKSNANFTARQVKGSLRIGQLPTDRVMKNGGRFTNLRGDAGESGMFSEPRSGGDRRKNLVPYMIPDSGCRRKRDRRSWRSRVNSDMWWTMRNYLRSE